MSYKLPTDFDPDRYRAAYPDVALSGLDPNEHFLRFGRIMGRSPTGKSSSRTSSEPVGDHAPAAAVAPRSGDRPSTARSTERSVPIQRPASDAIIERPPEFHPARVQASIAPPRPGADDNGSFSLEVFAAAPFAAPEERERLCQPLLAYAAMLSLPGIGDLRPGESPAIAGATLFRAGESRVENAWFADRSTLRLMIAGGPSASGWTLRAYQAQPSSSAELKSAGEGIQLPAAGPVFHDFELLHPLMPVVLELADSGGNTKCVAILPFPSLLPGGMHAAELRALQMDSNPMDAFWSLSEVLFAELIGDGDSPERSVTRLSADLGDCTKPEPLMSAEVQAWLASVFGITLCASDGAKRGKSAQLHLPRDAIPTISALVSRRIDVAGKSIAPFLIADPGTFRPRWSVVLPANSEFHPSLPVLRGSRRKVRADGTASRAPVHVAIAMRAGQLPLEVDGARPEPLPTESLPLTVVLSASEAELTEQAIMSLRQALGEELELLVRARGNDPAVRAAVDRACHSVGWSNGLVAGNLREIARQAGHEKMLTISDRARLGDGASFQALCDLLGDDSKNASASCVLLGETTVKKQAVLRPGSGGLFPAGVSFASSPRLTFSEPDVLEALAGLVYPVVANTLHFTLWRTAALAALPPSSARLPEAAEDIATGLELLNAGYRNLCTSRVQVAIAGPYARRDAIDPIGSAYLQPRNWEAILDRVTVVRELF